MQPNGAVRQPAKKPVSAPPRVHEEAERAVLGSMLVDKAAAVAAIDHLKATDFAREDHRVMFLAAVAVFKRDAALDIVTIAEEMRLKKTIATLNHADLTNAGSRYLFSCVNSVATTAHLEYYLRLVREASLDRQIGTQLLATAAEKTPENVRKLHELMVAFHGVRHDPILSFKKDLAAAVDQLLSAAPVALNTGFAGLDEILGGLEPGQLTTVGARTSGGKTALMTKLCMQMAEQTGQECLYLTTEMTNTEMVGRVLPMATSVPAWKFRWRKLTSEDEARVHQVCGDKLDKLPVHIFGKSRLSMSDIRHAATQTKARIVFVDYLQRCLYPQGDTRAYQIMDFMVELKSFAQENRLNVFIGCQLDRKLDKTAPEPENADLKDSGAIEAESDQVILLWRPTEKDTAKEAGYRAPTTNNYHIRAKVSKNRHGRAGERTDFLLNGPLVDVCDKIEVERALDEAAPQKELFPRGYSDH